ncbi:hypothetical protein H9P43_000897 [Blastocladiella emersonii ATCC 22665]|nr:hypothetical protein H9P43_000897 [Blastocladiella emersonii ATCC 22665]
MSTTAMPQFLSAARFVVVGASASREKFGNRVLRWYQQHGLEVVPVNPREKEIEGVAAVPSLAEVPGNPADYSVSVITPPAATAAVIKLGVERGFTRFWLQPGAEFPGWEAFAKDHGVAIIGGGACILRDAKL